MTWGHRGNAIFSKLLDVIYGIEFWQYLLMGGELGNETYIDLLLVSSGRSPPKFILIENDNFYTNLALKRCVLRFSRISRRDRVVKNKRLDFLRTPARFFFESVACQGYSTSNFCSPTCGGSRYTTLGSFVRFMAGPARRGMIDTYPVAY